MKTGKLKITLKDIAQKTCFSVNTVSKVLSGQAQNARISPATAKKVTSVANQLGYVPNQMARNLRAAHTGLIGVFVAEMTDPVYAAIAHSILEQLPKYDFFPLLTVAEAGIEQCRQTWMRNRVEGLIFCGTTSDMTATLFSYIKNAQIGTVIAGSFYQAPDQSPHAFDSSTVHIDNHAGMHMAICHLRQQGCSKIAFLAGPNWHSDSVERQRAYENLIEQYHTPIVADIGTSDQYWQRGYLAVDVLNREKTKFDAIIAYDDLVAIGAIKWFADHHINVPADIKVMGFDNLPQSEYSIPPLTSIEQPCITIGQRSVELLKGHLHCQTPTEHIRLTPSLKIRDSTK